MDTFALDFFEVSIVVLWIWGFLATLVLFLKDRCLRTATPLILALVIPFFGVFYTVIRLIRIALNRKSELKI